MTWTNYLYYSFDYYLFSTLYNLIILLLCRFYLLEGTINNSIPLEQAQDALVNMFY